jgi:hypothetical protein
MDYVLAGAAADGRSSRHCGWGVWGADGDGLPGGGGESSPSGRAVRALGRKGEADADIAMTEKKYGAQAPGALARWYVCHRDFDRASVWLDRAYRQRDTSLLWADECRRNLFSDPRYKAFLREMNWSE